MDASKLDKRVSVEGSLLLWMGVQGCICLALRHPAYTGPSRKVMEAFAFYLGQLLVREGVLTVEEFMEVCRVEAEESPHGAPALS